MESTRLQHAQLRGTVSSSPEKMKLRQRIENFKI